MHGWLVIVGTLEDGREVDLLHNRAPISWDKPDYIAQTYVNSRWRQYLMCIATMSASDNLTRHYYAVYLWKQWSGEHPDPDEQLRTIDIYFMKEMTQPDYKPSTLEKVRLSRTDCRTMLTDPQPLVIDP
jgi:hypothetical protein